MFSNFKFKDNLLFKIVVGVATAFFIFFVFLIVKGTNKNAEWVYKMGDSKLTSADYLLMLTGKVFEAEDSVKKAKKGENVLFEDFKYASVDGVPVSKFISDGVKKDVDELLAADIRFDNMGLSFSEEETDNIKKQAERFFMKCNRDFQAYKVGLSKEACERFIKLDTKSKKLVQELYLKEGASQFITEEDILNLANDKMVKYDKMIITLKQKDSKEGEDGEKKDDRDDEEKKRQLNEISEKILNEINGGKSFKEIEEANKESEDFAIKIESVFDFINEEESKMLNKSEFSKPFTKQEEKEAVKNMEIGQANLSDEGVARVIKQRVQINSEDVKANKKPMSKGGADELLKHLLIKSREDAANSKQKEETPLIENKGMLNKYDIMKQAKKVINNERELKPMGM